LPRRAGSEVAAEGGEEIARAEAVLVAPARGSRREISPAPDLDADVEVELGWRDPFQLHAVVGELVAEKDLVRERSIGEVPRVRVDLILVSDRREEPACLDGESIGQGEGLDIRLLDLDLVVRRYREDSGAAEDLVGVGRDRELRF